MLLVVSTCNSPARYKAFATAYALAARFEAGEATEDNVKAFALKHERESKQTSQGARSIREYKEGDLEDIYIIPQSTYSKNNQ